MFSGHNGITLITEKFPNVGGKEKTFVTLDYVKILKIKYQSMVHKRTD